MFPPASIHSYGSPGDEPRVQLVGNRIIWVWVKIYPPENPQVFFCISIGLHSTHRPMWLWFSGLKQLTIGAVGRESRSPMSRNLPIKQDPPGSTQIISGSSDRESGVNHGWSLWCDPRPLENLLETDGFL